MKKISRIGIGTMVLGLIGMAGAIDTGYGWKCSIILFGVGTLLACIGSVGEFFHEFNEDYKEYRSIVHGSSHDASYPSFLCK